MSFTPAKEITSSQEGIHPKLEKTVVRHLHSRLQSPIADFNQQAFDQAYQWWKDRGKPKVILDSCCGTGESSRHLAAVHPDYCVIGIDQSEKRLAHSDNAELPDNCLLLRSECADFWRLAEQSRWTFDLHTLFYPNPYPKPEHLQRRWHGHAVFKSLLAISPRLELRTNWDLYAEEFTAALQLAYAESTEPCQLMCSEYRPVETVTAFERKYLKSEHKLWRVLFAVLSPNAADSTFYALNRFS